MFNSETYFFYNVIPVVMQSIVVRPIKVKGHTNFLNNDVMM